MSSSKFIRSNVLITFLSLSGAGINFLSQMVIAYYFGTKVERDAYFSAVAVPTYLATLFAGSITVVFLPALMKVRKKNTPEETADFAGRTSALCILIIFLVVLLAFLFSGKIVSIIAPGYSAHQFTLTRQLFNILIFSALFQSGANFISVFHHVNNRFLWPAVSPVIIPFTSLISVLAFHQYGIYSLAIGTLVGAVISFMILVPGMVGNVRLQRVLKPIDSETWLVLKFAFPLLASGAIYRLTTIVERIIGSSLPSGSISYLGYSSQLYLLLAAIASGSIATTFFPVMSEAWAEGDTTRFSLLTNRALLLILLITLPIAAILIALGEPIIAILFQRGAFDSHATHAVASSLAILMGAFIFASMGNILLRAFYITNRTVAAAAISILEICFYTAAAYYLSSGLSYIGLAIALTASTAFTIVASLVLLHRWHYLRFGHFIGDSIKLITAAGVAGLIARTAFVLLDLPGAVPGPLIACLLGGMVYLVMVLYIVKISDAASMIKIIRTFFAKYFNKYPKTILIW